MTAGTKTVDKFAKESDLCAAFIADVAKRGKWNIYPETAGFDIVLARKSDGVQIGVEAKLRLNNKVVAQVLPRIRWGGEDSGPDYRAVLVPAYACENDLGPICDALGITVIRFRTPESHWSGPLSYPYLPDGASTVENDWHQWAPLRRLTLPDYIPDVDAGSSSPVQLTHWKIAAIKLVVLLELRPVTRADFKELGLSPSRWSDPYSGWLTWTEAGFVAGPRLPNFRAQHPVNFDQIKSDLPKWGAKLIAVRPHQLSLERSVVR